MLVVVVGDADISRQDGAARRHIYTRVLNARKLVTVRISPFTSGHDEVSHRRMASSLNEYVV
jgi:hypothetical protein